jgi:hypothetical protein
MATMADRIMELLERSEDCLDDDQIATRLGGVRRQHINQEARRLADRAAIVRKHGPGGKIVNCIPTREASPAMARPEPAVASLSASGLLAEDEVKLAVKEHLEASGHNVTVMWGRARGVDIDASGPEGRLLIEAKGEVSLQPQQVNYFLNAIGELVQRMSDETAEYGLALPDNQQYRGLVSRLPDVARRKLALRVFFVARSGSRYSVREG